MRCAYGKCNSDSRYRYKEYMKNVEFILFPKAHENINKCKKWVHACGRSGFSVKDVNLNTYMCTKHFVGGKGPTKENPYPMVLHTTAAGGIIRKRRLPFKERQEASKRQRIIETSPSIEVSELHPISIVADAPLESNEVVVSQEPCTSNASSDLKVDKNVSTTGSKYAIKLLCKIEESHTNELFKLSYQILSTSPEKFKFFCGLSMEIFDKLYTFLGPDKMKSLTMHPIGKKVKQTSTLSDKDKLCLTLVRLRRGFTLKELGYFFRIPAITASHIIYCCIQFMYLEFQRYKNIMFQDRFSQKRKLPCFKSFKNLRVIVDCTEVFIQMPKHFKEQGNAHSSFKNTNAVKFLVGISTSGAITYISDGYEDSETDATIFQDLVSRLVPEDVVMAGRSFNVQYMFDAVQATLLIPPFLKGRSEVTAVEEKLTRQIAKARIHVERANRHIKNYRILTRTIPNSLLPALSPMFYVICCLVNFERNNKK